VKRRQRVATTGEVPPELLDRSHPAWADDDSYRAWMVSHGLNPDVGVRLQFLNPQPGWSSWHPLKRRRYAMQEWAVAAGIVQEGRPGFPDWHRLRDMGLFP
jgi:hypothetical protein